MGYQYKNPKINAEKLKNWKYHVTIIELPSCKHCSPSFFGLLYTISFFFFSKVFALNHQILKPFGVILEFTLIGRQQGARHRRRLREFPGSHCGHWEILWIKRMVPGQRKEQRWGDGSPNEVVYQAKLELYAAKRLG